MGPDHIQKFQSLTDKMDRNKWWNVSKLHFIFLMAGNIDCLSLTYATNKVKRQNYSIDTKNIQSKYESPNDKKWSQK